MKVKVDIESQDKETEVSVQGLGVLLNGHTYDFDTEQTELFCVLNNRAKAPETLYIGKQPKPGTKADEKAEKEAEAIEKANAKAAEEQAAALQEAATNPVEGEDKAPVAEGDKKDGN